MMDCINSPAIKAECDTAFHTASRVDHVDHVAPFITKGATCGMDFGVSPPPPPPPRRVVRSRGKYFHWTLTYNTPGGVDEVPSDIMEWIEHNALKYLVVKETASQDHIQAVMVLKKEVSKDAVPMAFKRMNPSYKKPELVVHPHNDILGALGYQDYNILHNVGFTDKQLADAKAFYKARKEGQYYHAHVKTMKKIDAAEAKAMIELICHKEDLDEEEAAYKLVERGFIWNGCKNFDPFIEQCEMRDAVA